MNAAQILLLLLKRRKKYLFRDDFEGTSLKTGSSFWTKTDTYADEEQVTNGTFTSDISGWTDASDAGSSIAWNSGPKNMSMISDGAGFSRGRASVTAISGKAYTLTAVGTDDMIYKIGTSAGGSQIATAAIGGSGVLSVGFTATAATIHIEFSHNAAATRPLDNVSIKATSGLISVSGGALQIAGGKTTPAWADPALVSVKSWARQAGLTIEWQVTPGAANKELLVGFTDGSLATNAAEAHGIYFKDTGNISVILNAATGTVIPLAYTAVSTWARIVLKATGAYYYVSTDSRVTWKLIWIDSSVTTTPLYAFIESYNAALTASKVEVRQGSVLSVVLSASPGAPALTAGDTIVANGEFSVDTTGWTGIRCTIAAIAGGQSGNCLELTYVSGTTQDVAQQPTWVIGTWYAIEGYVKSGTSGNENYRFMIVNAAESATLTELTGTSSASWVARNGAHRATETNHKVWLRKGSATAGTMLFDTVSLKPLPFDQTGVLEYIGDAGVKLGIAKANITVAAGYHAGFVVCADSATAPTNSIWTYYDLTAGKAYLMKNTTELVAATVAYSAAAEQRVVIVGPVTAAYIGLYYGGALQGSVQGPYDLSAYGTHCHAFATDSAATVASFTFDTGVGA